MAGKIKCASGVILLILSTVLFIADFLSLHTLFMGILALLTFIISILTGKKLAAYLHDLHISKKRAVRLRPAIFIYIWMFLFSLFVILYTVMKIVSGSILKFLFLSLGGSYAGIIYNFLAFIGSVLLFAHLYSKRNGFITVWGKLSMETGDAMDRVLDGVKKSMDKATESIDELRNTFHKF